jgi:glycosyltransferase involved in cell wall biosynthesis
MIDIYLLCYNEEKLLQFVIDHHRKYFPNANIIFYDNMSTDNSINIIKANNCQIRSFNTGNSFNDIIHMNLKNSCWKEQSLNDWVLVADLDELPCITEDQLKQEQTLGTTILSLEGYTLIGPRTGFDLVNLKTGILKI